jgi:hypothetical protein
MQRVQELLIGRVATRLTGQGYAATEPKPAAIVGAAFACMQAARQAWFASDRTEPFSSYVDQAMATLSIRDAKAPTTS